MHLVQKEKNYKNGQIFLMKKMYNYLKYSGVSVILHLNPLHWKILPWVKKEFNDWAGERESTYSCGFLFLTVRVWIDNGDW